MSIKRVTVDVRHTFDLEIPDELLDEDGWELSTFVYDAFIDTEDDWDNVEYDIQDIKERNW